MITSMPHKRQNNQFVRKNTGKYGSLVKLLTGSPTEEVEDSKPPLLKEINFKTK